MDNYPLVSAILLAGNHPQPQITKAISCFRAQTYPYKELLIINNAHTQFEASGLNIQAEPNVFLIDTPYRFPAGLARNYGISAANGQILAQFDADYWHAPQRLESQIATMAANSAQVCMLTKTLSYSYYNQKLAYHTNKRGAALGTMVFVRPDKLDYPPADKGEEWGLLLKLNTAGYHPITMDKPNLACKLFGFTPKAVVKESTLTEEDTVLMTSMLGTET